MEEAGKKTVKSAVKVVKAVKKEEKGTLEKSIETVAGEATELAPKPLERTIDWRGLFAKSMLDQGQSFVEKEQYKEFYSSDNNAYAKIGYYQSVFRAQISGAPRFYTDEWDYRNFSCTCARGRKRKNGWYSATECTCSHEAALLLLWEKTHGPWHFIESDEEMAARLKQEQIGREKERRKEQWVREADFEYPVTKFLETLDKGIGNESRQDKEQDKDTAQGQDTAQNQDAAREEELTRDKGKGQDKVEGRDKKKEPFYFDLKKIFKKSQTNRYYRNRALTLLGEDVVELEQTEIAFNKQGTQVLKLAGSTSDLLGRNTVSMILSGEKPEECRCTCQIGARIPYLYDSSIFEWLPLCEHELAILARVRDYIEENNPGSATDQQAEDFFQAFVEAPVEPASQWAAEAVTKIQDVFLKPVITEEGGAAVLAFRVGLVGGKGFLLKNMGNLVDAVSGEQNFVLSKTAEIDFATHDFTEESTKWMAFVQGKVSETQEMNARLQSRSRWGYYYGTTLSVQNKESLTGTALDRFYDLAEGEEIDFQNKDQQDGYKKLVIGSRKIGIQLYSERITDSARHLLGIKVKGNMPVILEGNVACYILGQGALGRITKEEEALLAPFQKASDAKGNICFNVGRDKFSEFYYRVVPKLVEHDFIQFEDNCAKEMEKLLPPEPEFTFLLDMDADFCFLRERVRYGEEEFALPEKEKTAILSRDMAQEDRVNKVICKYFPIYEEGDGCYVALIKKNDDLFKLLVEAVPDLERYGEVRGSERFSRNTVRPMPQIRVGVSIEGGLLDISVLTKDMSPKELLAVLNSYQKKKKYHRLKSGDFVTLAGDEQLDSLKNLANEMDVSLENMIQKGAQVPAYRALYLDRVLEGRDALISNRSRTYRALIKNFNTIKDADYEVPAALEDVMRPYQNYGYKWLRTLAAAGFGGILADEMGLGKTLQMISVFSAIREEGETAPLLVVCPASLVYNWQEEIHRFAPGLKVMPIAGNAAARKEQLKELADGKESAVVCITSYDLLRKDIALYEKIMFYAAVLDEAQYIKNQKAAMTRSVKALKAKLRFALTGTPIENRLAELWSIFDFLMPGFLYGYEEFAKKFETPITKGKDKAASDKLKQLVGAFILRRLKADVLKDLPDKLEEVRYAQFEEEQRKVYDGQVVRMKQLLVGSEDLGKDKIKILAELTRLRQICCDPSLILEDYAGESTKRKSCMELIESARNGGHRMLIFSQFTSMLELLEEDLKREGIPFYKITGSTPKEQRLKLVKEFNEGDVPVFLISLKAGGTGLNLTGADIVIHYDPWWNLAAQNQATDRAHRIGQQRKVTVYRIIVKDTIEQKILALQEAKKDLAEEILSGDGTSLFTMSGEELLKLLE